MNGYRLPSRATTQSAAQQKRTLTEKPSENTGNVCSVRTTVQEKQVIVSTAEPPRPRTMPTIILTVLEEWGCTYMWNSLRLFGGDHLLEDVIEAGTCVSVTDGSFIQELISNVCSVPFILERNEGRGQITRSFPEQSNNSNA